MKYKHKFKIFITKLLWGSTPLVMNVTVDRKFRRFVLKSAVVLDSELTFNNCYTTIDNCKFIQRGVEIKINSNLPTINC